MVEELPELHDHVGEARVRDVVVRVVLLRNPPGMKKEISKFQTALLSIDDLSLRVSGIF